MNKSRAIQHWVDRLGLDRQAALTKWDEQVKVAKYSNNNGPVGQTLQIPVKVDEFLILEDAVIDEKSRELEHKRVKHNEEVQDLMEEGLKGRAATAEAIAEYGLSGMDNPEMVGNIFGRAASIAMPTASSAASSASDDAKKVPKNFDAASERLALKARMSQAVDKEASALMSALDEAEGSMDDAFHEALLSANTPSSEMEAMKLLRGRYAVGKALLGGFEPGKDAHDSAMAAEEDVLAYEAAIKENPEAQMPDVFKSVQPLRHVWSVLERELKGMSTHVEKKNIDNQFKPVLNMLAIMKTSLKSAADKLKKFSKDRQAREEKMKRQADQQALKQLKADSKKREAEEKKMNKAAEKQGRVESIFGIDFCKLGCRAMLPHDPRDEKITGLDFTKPFALKSDSPVCSNLHSVLGDARVVSCLDSFYNGFPGSVAALKGSKRFTTPVKESIALRSSILDQLSIADLHPGCAACLVFSLLGF